MKRDPGDHARTCAGAKCIVEAGLNRNRRSPHLGRVRRGPIVTSGRVYGLRLAGRATAAQRLAAVRLWRYVCGWQVIVGMVRLLCGVWPALSAALPGGTRPGQAYRVFWKQVLHRPSSAYAFFVMRPQAGHLTFGFAFLAIMLTPSCSLARSGASCGGTRPGQRVRLAK